MCVEIEGGGREGESCVHVLSGHCAHNLQRAQVLLLILFCFSPPPLLHFPGSRVSFECGC